MKTIPELLTQEVMNELAGKLWSTELSNFFRDYSDLFVMDFQSRYDDLLANPYFDNYHSSFIATYIFAKIRNEVEKLYKALTIQYSPIYNYYRHILEENTGTDTHEKTGSDSTSASGSDSQSYSGAIHESNVIDTSDSTVSSTTYDNATIQGFRPHTKEENNYSDHSDNTMNYNNILTHGKTDTTTYGSVLDMTYGRNVETTIEGINGIFTYQDLIIKEYKLRIEAPLFDTVLDLIVKTVSLGLFKEDE